MGNFVFIGFVCRTFGFIYKIFVGITVTTRCSKRSSAAQRSAETPKAGANTATRRANMIEPAKAAEAKYANAIAATDIVVE